MHRPDRSCSALAALSASGLALAAPAVAAPAPAARPVAHAAAPDELVVGYVAGATPAAQERARGRAGAVRAERVVAARADRAEVELVRLPAGKARDAAVRELESDPAVEYAEPNWIYTAPGDRPTTRTTPTAPCGACTATATTPANPYGSQAAEAWAAGHTGSSERLRRRHRRGHPVHPPRPRRQHLDQPVRPGRRRRQRRQRLRRRRPRLGLRQRRQHASTTAAPRVARRPRHARRRHHRRRGGNGSGVAGVNWNVTMISGKFLGRNGGSRPPTRSRRSTTSPT